MTSENTNLLDRVASGDGDALRQLLEQHGDVIWRQIDREIGDKWRSMLDADDVMQVTYMEAFLRMSQIVAKDEPAFIGWLRTVAMNNLRDAVKELGRKKRPQPSRQASGMGDGDSYVSLLETLSSDGETPSRLVARNEAATVLQEMLKRMPTDYAEVIRLYDLEGRDIDEVAEALKRSSGAVHMLRQRAHDCLRELLGKETNFFSQTA